MARSSGAPSPRLPWAAPPASAAPSLAGQNVLEVDADFRPPARRSARWAGLAGSLLLALASLPAQAGSAPTRIEVAVNGMVCAFCAQGIERKLRSLPATESVQVNLEQRLVLLTLRPGSTIEEAQLRSLIRNAGFDVRQIRRLPAAP
jgi:copper chaperone CopZ